MIRHRPNKSGPVPMGCPLEFSLKLLAGAWTPQIVWFLQTEPRRFGDLKRDLGNVSAKVLTTRLREMEEKGIITRKVMPTSPPTVEYALTEVGRKIGPALQSIVQVGEEIQKHLSREKPETHKPVKKTTLVSAV
jgi:DNA-binding HxlR family transcriptional regulator